MRMKTGSDVTLWALAAVVLMVVLVLTPLGTDQSRRLPYGVSNPVIYDKDEAVDQYVDEYLLALASIGEIQLKGMITSSSIAPENRWVTLQTTNGW
jgi:hypothetical protein